MAWYISKRLLLILPTLFGIMVLNFVIIQAAPGGPVEQMLAQLKGHAAGATDRFSSTGQDMVAPSSATNSDSSYRGAQGLDPALVDDIKTRFGFDKPPVERFFTMLVRYVQFDFGDSFFRNESVVNLVLDKLPVSISLGLWTTLLVYLISIPLGIAKAVRDGSRFDMVTSTIIIIGYAIPGFLFALLLIILFAGGSFWQIFPLRGLTSDDWDTLSIGGKALDYLWHITLPVIAMVIGGFASLTFLAKNSFLEEIYKQYVTTARAKGATENRVLYRHVFRNAMLIVIAGLPDAFLKIFFTGALLIEVIFSLDGLGLLGYEAAIKRDYPVIFGTLYVFTLMGLLLNLIGDILYTIIDPRIDFSARR